MDTTGGRDSFSKHQKTSVFTIFGIPIGAAFGLSLNNMAFLGIGLPIGMSIGLAMGARMDNKAKEEGRQLDIELKV